jgi:tetratricopeptide (TPR) repeat protein
VRGLALLRHPQGYRCEFFPGSCIPRGTHARFGAIKLDPKNFWAYLNRAAVHSHLGNYQQALKDYNRAIQLAPNAFLAYNSRGNLYLKLDNYKQALEDYSKTVKLAPQFEEGIVIGVLFGFRFHLLLSFLRGSL